MDKQTYILASVAAAALLLLPSTYATAQFTLFSSGAEVYRQAVGTPDSVVLSFAPKVKASQECDPSTVGGTIATASEAVDLGLSVKWASWNIGANSAGEAGAYFAWGEVQAGKENYNWSSYWWMQDGEDEEEHITKYQTEDNKRTADWYAVNFIGDGKTTLEKADDAAAVNWGGTWRMPTQAELQELCESCTWEWKEEGGFADGSLAGYLVTGPNGNSIFLPAAGDCYSGLGSNGCYMSSNLGSSDIGSAYANFLSFNSSDYSASWNSIRNSGMTIRPVCPVTK